MNGVPALVIPSTTTDRAHSGAAGRPVVRRPLPLANLASATVSSMVYGMATVGDRGQLADQVVVRALGWRPSRAGHRGIRLVIGEHGGLVLLIAEPAGLFGLTGQGRLRLPAAVRHRCRIQPGDRVLLAADPATGCLVVHPPAQLAAMVERRHADLLGGTTP